MAGFCGYFAQRPAPAKVAGPGMCLGQRTQQCSVGVRLTITGDDLAFDAPSTQCVGRLDLQRRWIYLFGLQTKFVCQFCRVQIQGDVPLDQTAFGEEVCEKAWRGLVRAKLVEAGRAFS